MFFDVITAVFRNLLNSLIIIISIGLSSASAQDKTDSLDVFIFLAEGCPVCQSVTVEINRVQMEFQQSPIKFYGIFPGKLSSGESRDAFKKKYKLKFDLLADSNQSISKKLNASITPEVVIVNKSKNEIIYRGLIDDSFAAVGKRRTVSKKTYLYDAIKTYNNQSIISEFTNPVGCKITW